MTRVPNELVEHHVHSGLHLLRIVILFVCFGAIAACSKSASTSNVSEKGTEAPAPTDNKKVLFLMPAHEVNDPMTDEKGISEIVISIGLGEKIDVEESKGTEATKGEYTKQPAIIRASGKRMGGMIYIQVPVKSGDSLTDIRSKGDTVIRYKVNQGRQYRDEKVHVVEGALKSKK